MISSGWPWKRFNRLIDWIVQVNAYSPGLSGAWMLQRAMSVRPGERPDPNFINSLLSKNFAAMQRFGDPVLKPFLQVHPSFLPCS